jgi:hypothetical protein
VDIVEVSSKQSKGERERERERWADIKDQYMARI